MRFLISAIAGALLVVSCTVVPPQKAPVSTPAVVETAPADSPAPRAKAKKSREIRKDTKTKAKQIRAVAKGTVPDCGLVLWAASTFDEEKIKRLERTASAEQKKHAKACLDGKG